MKPEVYNFQEFKLLEYFNKIKNNFDIKKFLNDIKVEDNNKMLYNLIKVLDFKIEVLGDIEEYYKDNINMLLFAEEIAKETDEENIKILKNLISNNIDKETKTKTKIGFNRQQIQTEAPKAKTKIGYKLESSFINFINLDF